MRLQELKCFEGGKNLVQWLPEPVDGDHQNWKLGTNSAGGGMRALRMLMPMGMALDLLEHADMSIFVTAAGGVECHPDQLRIPDHPVWFLKDGELTETRLTDLQSQVHCVLTHEPDLGCDLLQYPRSASARLYCTACATSHAHPP